jgi:hypothetical protein
MRLTFDLTTEQVAKIRRMRTVVDAVLSGNTDYDGLRALAAGLEEVEEIHPVCAADEEIHPVCAADERLIVNAQAFRDFHDGAVSDYQAELIANASDEDIEYFVNLDAIYISGWATVCENALDELDTRAQLARAREKGADDANG